jgi:aminopeptidase N
MERMSGRDLRRFFDAWVYGTQIPRIKFAYHLDGGTARLQFEQHAAPVDVPITVTVNYADGSSEDVVVVLSEKLTDRVIPIKGGVRSITANADNASLVEVDK